MAQGLIPKLESLQMEDIEILTEDQIKNELEADASSPNILDHIKRNFQARGINIDQFSNNRAALTNTPINILRSTVLLLRNTLIDLAAYSEEFREHQLSVDIGRLINHPYTQTMGEFLQRFFYFIRLTNNDILNIQSKRKGELVAAIMNITELIRWMRAYRLPFQQWHIPDMLS